MDVEGLWENDKFIADRDTIKSYDTYNDPRATRIEVFKYLYPDIDSIRGPEKPTPSSSSTESSSTEPSTTEYSDDETGAEETSSFR